MLDGIDHNPSVSAPDGQVARLRTGHSLKFVNPRIEVGRGRVLIRETGAGIESVDKMGTIGKETRMMTGIQCGA